jgi:addiction module HigA family antidote
MSDDETKPIHPGEVLLEVYMKPSYPEITVETLSQTLRVPQQFLTDFINGRRGITPSLALRLGVICRTTADYWLDLQKTYDLQTGKKRGTGERHRKDSQTSHPAAA